MSSKWFKTSGGEVYGKCGITFGAEPVEVSEKDLGTKRGDLGLTIGQRLAEDPRLVEVEPPTRAKEAAKPTGGEQADGGKGKAGDEKAAK